MIIKIVYDNTSYRNDMKADWGFSAYIQDLNILFDTGANGDILIENMKKMKIEPAGIQELFISHSHWDHTGGIKKLLQLNENIKIYVPHSYDLKANKVTPIKNATEIRKNVYSTGELSGIEQSMVIKINNKIIILVGCSHPGVRNIVSKAKQFGEPYAIIGGFHDFDEYKILEQFEMVCPTHCTQHKKEIKEIYPEKYIEGGAGRIIKIDIDREK